MYIFELFHGGPEQPKDKPQAGIVEEANQAQLVVVFGGRFQPFHHGHHQVFAKLQNTFGRDNVYISTANNLTDPKTVWNFSDRVKFMTAAGVPVDRIIEQASPLKLAPQFDPASTIFVLARGAKDAAKIGVGSTKQNGSPSYFQWFKSVAQCETADKHGYIIPMKEEEDLYQTKGLGTKSLSRGTDVRAVWNQVRNDPTERARLLTHLFRRNDPELGRLMDRIPTAVGESLEEGAPIVVMPMLRRRAAEPTRYPEIMGSYRQGVDAAKAGKPYHNPFPFDAKLGAPGNYDHNSYREGYQSVKGLEETTGTTMKSKEVTEATSAAVRLAKAVQRTQGKTAASQARSVIPSSIPKKEVPKKQATEGDTLYDAKETAINEESPLSQVGFSDTFINSVYRGYNIKHTELPEPMTKKPTVADLDKYVFLSKTNAGKAFAVGKGNKSWSGAAMGYVTIDNGDGTLKDMRMPPSKAIAQVAKGEYYAIPYAGWGDRIRGQDSTKYKRAHPRDGRQVDPQDASYEYMQKIDKIYGNKIRSEMNRVVDFVYANMRKFGKDQNSRISGTSPQERVLQIANTLEAAANNKDLFTTRSGSWDRPSYMDQYLNSLGQLSHGFASIPTNYSRFKEVMDETPAGLARLAKFILGTVHAYEETVKELLYKDTVDALKQQ